MLPLRNRLYLRLHPDYYRWSFLSTPAYKLFYSYSTGDIKAAVVVSKKLAVLSSQRNQIKRLVRECLKELMAKFPSAGLNLVVLAGREIKNMNKKQIQQSLFESLRQIIG